MAALSPRRRQGETSPYKVTTNSPGSRGDVAATYLQSPWSPAGLGDISETSQRRRGDVSPVADKISRRNWWRRRGDFSETCWRLEKVSKKSNMFEFAATLGSILEAAGRGWVAHLCARGWIVLKYIILSYGMLIVSFEINWTLHWYHMFVEVIDWNLLSH